MTKQPTRTDAHRRLEVFLGDWRATGVAYTGSASAADRMQGESPWSSTHTGRWHTGEFFLIQDERARVGDDEFDTLSLLGVDPETGRYVMRTFDNGGFHRQYELTVDGSRWTITGPPNWPRSPSAMTTGGKPSVGSGNPPKHGFRYAIA